MNANKHFIKGAAAFKCDCCTRMTRHTTQPQDSRLCEDCWELAGIYNHYQDGGLVADYASQIRRRCQRIIDNGGKLDGDASSLLDLAGIGILLPAKPKLDKFAAKRIRLRTAEQCKVLDAAIMVLAERGKTPLSQLVKEFADELRAQT